MNRGYPESMTDVWSGVAGEFLHLYPRGRRLLAVAGADAARSRRAASDLGAALRDAGASVDLFHAETVDEQALRSLIVAPFRQGDDGDRVLVVSGPTALADETIRRLWHSTIWQLAGDEIANTDAAAIIDVSDPAHPTRRYSDFCTCDIGEAPLMSPVTSSR